MNTYLSWVILLRTELLKRKLTNGFTLYMIQQRKNNACDLDRFSRTTKNLFHYFKILNAMSADDLAMHIAKASAVIIFIWFTWNIKLPAFGESISSLAKLAKYW